MPCNKEIYERLAGIEQAMKDTRADLAELKPKIETACDTCIRQDVRIGTLEAHWSQRATHSWAIVLALIVTGLNTLPNIIRFLISLSATVK